MGETISSRYPNSLSYVMILMAKYLWGSSSSGYKEVLGTVAIASKIVMLKLRALIIYHIYGGVWHTPWQHLLQEMCQLPHNKKVR